MIKKRSRPQPRIRESSPGTAEDLKDEQRGLDEQEALSYVVIPLRYGCLTACCHPSIADLLELRKLRKARQGIDASKLTNGDNKRKKSDPEGVIQGGLKKGAPADDEECVLRCLFIADLSRTWPRVLNVQGRIGRK